MELGGARAVRVELRVPETLAKLGETIALTTWIGGGGGRLGSGAGGGGVKGACTGVRSASKPSEELRQACVPVKA